MREIAAASDFDFVASEPAPVRKKNGARKGKSRAGGFFGPAWLSQLWTWRTPLFGGFAFVVLLTAIAVNAMFLQHGRHPAPLMGSVLKIEPPKVVEPAPAPEKPQPVKAEIPQVEPTPAGHAAQVDSAALEAALSGAPIPKPVPARTAAKPAPVVRPVVQPVAVKPAQPAKADPVAALMEKSAPPAAPQKIAAAQKALNILGAHVAANGQFDGATRKALEKFQRDNGLPATGVLTPALRHYLALQAGMPVD